MTIDNFLHIMYNENFDEGRIKFLTRQLKTKKCSAMSCLCDETK